MSDRPEFRFWTVWHEPSPVLPDLTTEHADHHRYSDLDTARRAHRSACEGRWVKDGMSKVHVSALRVWKWGRQLQEELAVKRDRCDVHGVWACGDCESDRRREAA